MVLNYSRGNPGIRFIFGIAVISLSIYFFYVSIARRNSPELFLEPISVVKANYPCNTVKSVKLEGCIPANMSFNTMDDGSIHFYSISPNLRGTIKLYPSFPGDKRWRDSLKRPFIRMFVGDIDRLGTFGLMMNILRHKWNPSLMGPKSKIIPSWMKNKPDARILILEADKAIIFYTRDRSMSIRFFGKKVLFISITGRLNDGIIAGILDSIALFS